MIISKNTINVLGVHFDATLNWQIHVQKETTKNPALQAIVFIHKHFKKELMSMVITNYYSILYYNAEIWLIPLT